MTKNGEPNHNAAIPPNDAQHRSGSDQAAGPAGFDTYMAVFRTHFAEHYAATGRRYEDYRPVYRYGYDLGMDTRYRHADWAVVEQASQPAWEARNPGTWAQFRDTIKFAWGTTRVVR